MKTFELLDFDAPEYQNLKTGDKKALKHLVKAASILDNVYKKQDNKDNISVEIALKEAALQGERLAQKALKLYTSQKGLAALDRNSKLIKIVDTKNSDGRNFYPDDLTSELPDQNLKETSPKEYKKQVETMEKNQEKFHKIIEKMLDKGKIEEVKAVLSDRTMVRWNEEKTELVGIDYTKFFKKEYIKAAEEISKAAKTATDYNFVQYLEAQALALIYKNEEYDALAETLFTQLPENTPIEFTISKEAYEDGLTDSIDNNKKLSEKLKKNGITRQVKDSIGIRVGIVNKNSIKELSKQRDALHKLAKTMPLSDKYSQTSSNDTVADVDLVYLAGDYSGFRGAIVVAQNLPNDTKLSAIRGCGRRNTFHRQIMNYDYSDPQVKKERLNATLDKSLHHHIKDIAGFRFTLGHELGHTLGPSENKKNLGENSDAIEEIKADLTSIHNLKYLNEMGIYSKDEINDIAINWTYTCLLKQKPQRSPHRVGDVMELNYLMDNNVVKITKKGVMEIDVDKVIPTASKMLKDIIKIQLSQDPKKAEKYVDKYFRWEDDIERASAKLRPISKLLHGQLNMPLADMMLNDKS